MRAFAYQAVHAASGVLLCPTYELSCPAPLESHHLCPVTSVAEFWVRFAPIGFLLFLLGFVVGSLVCGGRSRVVEVSYPTGSRSVGSVRNGATRRPAAEDW